MTTRVIHVTAIRHGQDVWGHDTSCCDASGCAAGADRYYKGINAEEITPGHVYEIDTDGTIIAEIVEC
jgi:hypothetical protein